MDTPQIAAAMKEFDPELRAALARFCGHLAMSLYRPRHRYIQPLSDAGAARARKRRKKMDALSKTLIRARAEARLARGRPPKAQKNSPGGPF
jgi:hypothetical protein